MFIFQPDRHLLGRFVAAHAPKMSGDVLDLGGGSRRYVHLFAHCKNYRILDLNPDTHPDIVASVEHIPLPDHTVDGIVCTQVLGDVPDVRLAITEMGRILKKGGALLITESLFNEQHDEPNDYWRFTEFAWRHLLEPMFSIESMERRGGYFSMRCQNSLRYLIEKYSLYRRPLLGRLVNVWATCSGKYALMRDALDNSPVKNKFPIGHCIFARKL